MNLYLSFYTAISSVAAVLLLPVMLLRPKWQEGLTQRWGFSLPVCSQSIWFHAVSVGELNAIWPLLECYLAQTSERLLVSTTTKTAQTLLKQRIAQAQLQSRVTPVYFPLDLPWVCQRFFEHFSPKLLIIAETELWPTVILQASCPVAVVNARLSARSAKRYRWIRPLIQQVLSRVALLACQHSQDEQQFLSLGARPETCKAFGQLKFDVAWPAPLPEALQQHSDRQPIVTLGSVHPDEWPALVAAMHRLQQAVPNLVCIWVPRHPEKAPLLCRDLQQKDVSITKRSSQPLQSVDAFLVQQLPTARHIVIDSIGELTRAYQWATVAVVGGSFSPARGGQNPLEPLVCGKPTVVGPYMRNFHSLLATLLSQTGMQQVSADQLDSSILSIFNKSCKLSTESTLAFLRQQQGVTQRLFTKLSQLA